MAQINLKKILLEDDISKLIDIVNYNFEQIILNGGGPSGEQGIIGPPGLPGIMGPQGELGPQGIDGTYIFTSNVPYSDYHFGENGESIPRNNDLYFEIKESEISISKYENGSWEFVKTISSPIFSKILKDRRSILDPSDTKYKYLSNDITKAQNVFISDANFYANNNLINTNENKFEDVFTYLNKSPNVFAVASDKNQIRIFNSSNNFLSEDIFEVYTEKGGIIHSYEFDGTDQWYKITNGDTIGNKNLLISLNSNNTNNLLIGNTNNQLLIGGNENEISILKSRVTINKSLVIGDSDFYQNISNINNGIISQGNLSIGDSYNNTIYKGAFVDNYGRGSRVLIDTKSSVLASSQSILSLGVNAGTTSSNLQNNNSYKFNFILDGCINSITRNNLLISEEIYKNGNNYYIDYITLKHDNTLTEGSIGIRCTNPKGLLEIGNSNIKKISIGTINTGATQQYMFSYIGFNAMKIVGENDEWYRYENNNIENGATGNSAKILWNSIQNDINFSIIPSEETNYSNQYNNDDVYNNTTLTLTKNNVDGTMYPLLIMSNDNSHNFLGITGIDKISGIIIGNSPNDNINDIDYENGRLLTAMFGNAIATNTYNGYGSPVIYATNGLNNNDIIKPHYTMYNMDSSGLYFSEGISSNLFGQSNIYKGLGLSIYKKSAIHIVKDDNDKIRIGVNDINPLENISINKILVYHEDDENNSSFIGYNVYKNNSDDLLYPINTGSLTGDDGKGSILLKFGLYDKKINQTDTNGGIYLDGGELSISSSYSANSPNEQIINENSNTSSIIRIITNGRPHNHPMRIYQYHNNNFVPKILIGFKDNKLYEKSDTGLNILRRGTLSLLSQYITCTKDSTNETFVIDDYAIALYDHLANPVLGISPHTISTSPSITKSISLRLLSNKKCNIGDISGTTGNDFTFFKYQNSYNNTTNKWNGNGSVDIYSQTNIDSLAVGSNTLHSFKQIVPLNLKIVRVGSGLMLDSNSIGYEYLRDPYFHINPKGINVKEIEFYLNDFNDAFNQDKTFAIATLTNFQTIIGDDTIIMLTNTKFEIYANNNTNKITIKLYAINKNTLDLSKIQSMSISILLIENENKNIDNILNNTINNINNSTQ